MDWQNGVIVVGIFIVLAALATIAEYISLLVWIRKERKHIGVIGGFIGAFFCGLFGMIIDIIVGIAETGLLIMVSGVFIGFIVGVAANKIIRLIIEGWFRVNQSKGNDNVLHKLNLPEN